MILHALKLLEAKNGPVLEEFPKDAPFKKTDGGPPACPVDFSPHTEAITEIEGLLSAFRQELSQMQNWYDLSLEKRGRTTANSTGLPLDKIVEFLDSFIKSESFIKNENTVNPRPDTSLATVLKLAVEDLKAYYLEAITIQPGQPTDSASLADWFWGQTTAAHIINQARCICADSTDEKLKRAANFLIPKNQLHRFND